MRLKSDVRVQLSFAPEYVRAVILVLTGLLSTRAKRAAPIRPSSLTSGPLPFSGL